MPILPLIQFIVIGVIWLAVVLTVLTEGFGPGMHLWMQIFVLVGFPMAAYWSWLRLRSVRRKPE
jgi:hypothetical protein